MEKESFENIDQSLGRSIGVNYVSPGSQAGMQFSAWPEKWNDLAIDLCFSVFKIDFFSNQ